MNDQPYLYEKIATVMRDKIASGDLSWGSRFPSQETLSEQFSVSRQVVRQALDILEAEGLIDRVRGGGAFVRRYQPLVRRPALHYRSNPGAPFAEEALASERIPRYSHDTRQEAATEDIAKRLQINVGDPVMHTGYISYANDDPMMTVESYEPVALTRDTPIERPEEGPLPGAGLVDRFTSIGLRPTAVVERLRIRMPRPSEAEHLKLRRGVPVVLIVRSTYASHLPVETADLLLSAEYYELEYAIHVDPEADQ